MELEMRKTDLRIRVGHNVRALRTERGMSIDVLAKILDITPGYLGLIERGERGTNALTLVKLSSIFDVTVDFILSEPGSGTPHKNDSAIEIRSKNLLSLTNGYTETDLDFIIDVIKSYSETKYRENNE